LQKIEAMKKGIPPIDIFTKYTGEKSTAWHAPTNFHRFGGASDAAYERVLIDRATARADKLLSKLKK
jgi:hypothetical protein